eukprot:4478972-Pleurochrysis_carterae.AAC.2
MLRTASVDEAHTAAAAPSAAGACSRASAANASPAVPSAKPAASAREWRVSSSHTALNRGNQRVAPSLEANVSAVACTVACTTPRPSFAFAGSLAKTARAAARACGSRRSSVSRSAPSTAPGSVTRDTATPPNAASPSGKQLARTPAVGGGSMERAVGFAATSAANAADSSAARSAGIGNIGASLARSSATAESVSKGTVFGNGTKLGAAKQLRTVRIAASVGTR